MAVKGAKTIAQYAIMRWLEREGFVLDCFRLDFTSEYEAIVMDSTGDRLRVVYDKTSKVVFAAEM